MAVTQGGVRCRNNARGSQTTTLAAAARAVILPPLVVHPKKLSTKTKQSKLEKRQRRKGRLTRHKAAAEKIAASPEQRRGCNPSHHLRFCFLLECLTRHGQIRLEGLLHVDGPWLPWCSRTTLPTGVSSLKLIGHQGVQMFTTEEQPNETVDFNVTWRSGRRRLTQRVIKSQKTIYSLKPHHPPTRGQAQHQGQQKGGNQRHKSRRMWRRGDRCVCILEQFSVHI
jgi:hypothetical protein